MLNVTDKGYTVKYEVTETPRVSLARNILTGKYFRLCYIIFSSMDSLRKGYNCLSGRLWRFKHFSPRLSVIHDP